MLRGACDGSAQRLAMPLLLFFLGGGVAQSILLGNYLFVLNIKCNPKYETLNIKLFNNNFIEIILGEECEIFGDWGLRVISGK